MCSLKTDLAREVDDAVASALARLGRDALWRTYSGQQQAELAAQLGAVLGCSDIGLTSSGTAALEMALRACRLAPGDEVLLAGYDYPGSFAAIERVGARPALVDVEASSWNLSFASLNAVVRPECRVLVASHLHGQLQPMAALVQWCRQRKIWLIQDACQALGATIDGQSLGQHGDMTILSFGGSKLISAGRGGAWATNNSELAQRTRLAAGVGSGAYELSELQATAILAQLPFLDRMTDCCREFFARQAALLAVTCPRASAPWLENLQETAFYQAGWILLAQSDLAQAKTDTLLVSSDEDPEGASPVEPWPGNAPNLENESRGEFSQARRAAHERIGIGAGFPGFHRRSPRRCRVEAALRNTESIVRSTLTVHYRAALNDLPVAEMIAIRSNKGLVD